jgi:hypothetical protein
MPCARCQVEVANAGRWCADCERHFDTWSRRYATDIIWSALGGMVVVITGAMVVPLLGVPWVWATTAIVGGSATILGIHRWNGRRRRMQFLRGDAMPRAYLPTKP